MKRAGLFILIVITLNLFIIHVGSAQSKKFSENIKFGIKGGFNWTSTNDEDRVQDGQVNPRPGFHIGGLAHYHLTDKWALQTEVMYSKEGALYDFPGSATIGRYEGKTDLNFINFPFLVQYMVLSGFRIQSGLQLGLVKSAKYEDPYNEESEKDDVQRGNVSWTVGFGYLTKSGFGIDARYNGGLSNVYKEGYYPGQSARTRAGQIGFFYQFK